MANNRIGGLIEVKVGGTIYAAKGKFTYNLGRPKKEMIAGSDSIHGYKIAPQIPFLEGIFTDSDETDVAALRDLVDVTVTLTLANGKIIVIEQAVEASDGNGETEEGELTVRFEGKSAREIS